MGNFENDYRHGYGELYKGDELRYKGFWVNDVLLGEDDVNANKQALSSTNKKASAR